jgi:hypothetical protein
VLPESLSITSKDGTQPLAAVVEPDQPGCRKDDDQPEQMDSPLPGSLALPRRGGSDR